MWCSFLLNEFVLPASQPSLLLKSWTLTERCCLWSVFSCTFSTFFWWFWKCWPQNKCRSPLVLSSLPWDLVRPHYTLLILQKQQGQRQRSLLHQECTILQMHHGFIFTIFFSLNTGSWLLLEGRFQTDRVFLGNELSSKFCLCDRFLDQHASYLIKLLSETICGTLPQCHGAVLFALLYWVKTIEDDTANSKKQMLPLCRYLQTIIP